MANKSVVARTIHKWLALIVGVQALLWFISGAYMTIVPLDIIHGDHLEHVHSDPLELSAAKRGKGLDALKRHFPGAEKVEFATMDGRTVIKTVAGTNAGVIDLESGAVLTPIGREMAMRIAGAAYVGSGKAVEAQWITKAPQEVSTRPVPLWAVQFDDFGHTTFYVAPSSGNIVARRHTLWRIFDFVWMLHIMDYKARVDVHNPLLQTAIIVAILMALSGIWLLLYSFHRRDRK